MIAADYPFFDIFWTMVIFFTWVIWIWMMIAIFTDIFRRRDIGGWHKAAWAVFLIVLPFLVIDLIVATLTMSMGMMMLPPTVLSLPFKILFFVLIDGWNILIGSLIRSYS